MDGGHGRPSELLDALGLKVELMASCVLMSVADLWSAGVHLTTNLELVRTRGI